MSSDFGRVPELDMTEDAPKKEEEKIFDKPKENVSMKIKEEPKKEDDKKLKLKEHLAKCRQKSIEVRRAKAEEKKKNKKPRGRPRKEKEEEQPKVNVQSLPEPVIEKTLPPPEEKEIFKEVKQTLDDGTEVKYAVSLDDQQNDVMEKDQPVKQPQLNLDDLWSKLSSKIDEKLSTTQTLTPIQTPQDNFIKYYEEMKAREDQIRKDEREKMKAEALQHKQNILTGATNKYFNKLGYSTPQPKQPVVSSEPTNAWDNLLNPRRKY